jgi:Aspartyl/Asparaginyl beta-hydroxylase
VNHFMPLASGVDISPLMLAIHRQDKDKGIWKDDTYLRDYPQGPFGDCESIILRFPPRTVHETEEALKEHLENFDQHECVDQPVFKILPEARPIIFGLMNFVNGERLGRVIINKVKPGGVIYPHADTPAHAKYYDRFHVVLESSPGVIFRAGDEKVYMPTGSIWWFNNAVEHEVINNSADNRIHMVIDIRTSK